MTGFGISTEKKSMPVTAKRRRAPQIVALSMGFVARDHHALANGITTSKPDYETRALLRTIALASRRSERGRRAARPRADYDAWPKAEEVAATICFLASPENKVTRAGHRAGVWAVVGFVGWAKAERTRRRAHRLFARPIVGGHARPSARLAHPTETKNHCAAAGIRCSGAWRARRRTEFEATMVRLAA